MSLAALIRGMSEAGAPAEAIALAVEAIEARDAALEARRTAERDRKRRQRAGQSRDNAGTVTGQSEDSHGAKVPSPPFPNKTNNPIPPNLQNSHRASAESEFDIGFWPKYPHKTGKPVALRAFIAARRKHELWQILDGLARYVKTKPADRSWLNPATFLNQERYLDAPAAAAARGPPPNSKLSFADLARQFPLESKPDEPDRHGQTAASPNAADARSRHADLEPAERRSSAGGAVVDLRQAGSGWR